MSDFIITLLIAILMIVFGYFAGRHAGRIEYFEGRIECKQAFEIIECKKVKK